jgi:CRP-like cAMP-binding protein
MNADEARWLFTKLRSIQFFSAFSLESIDAILAQFQKYTCRAGKTVIKEGRTGKAFFIIYKGKARVTKRTRLWFSRKIAGLEEGSFFGEMSLLGDIPTTASVIAETKSEMFMLLKSDFLSVLNANPQLAKELRQVAEQRREEPDNKRIS